MERQPHERADDDEHQGVVHTDLPQQRCDTHGDEGTGEPAEGDAARVEDRDHDDGAQDRDDVEA